LRFIVAPNTSSETRRTSITIAKQEFVIDQQGFTSGTNCSDGSAAAPQLTATNMGPGIVQLRWHTPAAAPRSFDLRFSISELSEATWDDSNVQRQIMGMPQPRANTD
jgi:hypothetical protein